MISSGSPTALVFDKYAVFHRIAIGGMGEIFLARQIDVPGSERLVILKSLLPDLSFEKRFVEQFMDEARVAETLNHPNIVSVYEVGVWENTYFIAMEYIRGENLARLLQGALDQSINYIPSVPVQIVHDAALALDYAHYARDDNGNALAIVHRDIGLQNIMVREDGVTKVVDFGIARAKNSMGRTRTGFIKGKVQYMSPEQIAGQELDGRSDQFALGIVLWELLTRQRLFKGEHDFQTLQKIIRDPIPPPSSIALNVPPFLDQIVMKMLHRSREQRFARCVHVAEALQQFMIETKGPDPMSETSAFVRAVVGEKLQTNIESIQSYPATPFSSAHEMGRFAPQSLMSPASQVGNEIRRSFLSSKKENLRIRLFMAFIALFGLMAGLFTAFKLGQKPHAVSTLLEIRNPVGASIKIDNEYWPDLVPTSIHGLLPGIHKIRLELGALPTIRKQVHLRLDQKVVINEKPPARGMVIDIREPKKAKIYINDVLWNTRVPSVISGLEPGKHIVQLKLAPDIILTREVELEIDKPVLIQEAPPATDMVIDIREPENALVHVDGVLWNENVPTVITNLEAGPHTLRLTLPKSPSLIKNINLLPNSPVLIREKAPAQGTVIDIRTPSEAQLKINGRLWPERVPTVIRELNPGWYNLQFIHDDQILDEKRVLLKENQALLIQDDEQMIASIHIHSNPPRAQIWYGKNRLGATPLLIDSLPTGKTHRLLIKKRGFQNLKLDVNLLPREQKEIEVVLNNSVGDDTFHDSAFSNISDTVFGFLTISTNPKAKVIINGKAYGSTPLNRQKLPIGFHTLELKNDQYEISKRQTVHIEADIVRNLNLNLLD